MVFTEMSLHADIVKNLILALHANILIEGKNHSTTKTGMAQTQRDTTTG